MNPFLRCLQDLDVDTARKLWAKTNPHLPQPANDHEMLIQLHLGRLQSQSVTERQKAYSRRWLSEREIGRHAMAVGIAVGAPVHRMRRALNIRAAMEDAVDQSMKAGVNIDTEAPEVKRRIVKARNKEMGIGRTLVGPRKAQI